MKILAIDSAHGTCSAAFFCDGRILGESVEEMERGQAERLILMIQEVLKASDHDFKSLDAIAVTTGPGSFTGVRVGLATADGLALAADLPMIGVSVFDALAWKIHQKNPDVKKLCLVLETKRDDFYVQCFDGLSAIGEPCAKTAEEIAAFSSGYTFAGNGSDRLKQDIALSDICDVSMPTASDVAFVAAQRPPVKEFPQAMYLREAEVTVCRK